MLVGILMQRDDISLQEAKEIVEDMRQRVMEGENPEEVLFEEGLEPDYVLDILP